MSAGFTTVTASYLQDATGQPLGNATIFFTPVLSARAGGPQGQIVASPISAQVIGGAFTLQLADTAATNPSPSAYSVALIDNLSGASLLGPGYGNVQPTGANWNFDTYVPAQAAVAPYTQGPPGTPGEVTLSALSTVLPSVPQILGLIGSVNNTDNGVYVKAIGAPVTAQCYLYALTLSVASFDPGAIATLLVLQPVGGANTFEVAHRFTLQIAATGNQTYTQGTSFSGVLLQPGWMLGILTDSSWAYANTTDGNAPFPLFHAGDPGSSAAAFSTDQRAINCTASLVTFTALATAASVTPTATVAANAAATAAVAAAFTASTETYGTAPSGSASTNYSTGSGAKSVMNAAPTTSAGNLLSVTLKVNAFTPGTGNLNVIVATLSSGNNFTVNQVIPVTVTGTGLETIPMPAGIVVPSGSYVGYYTGGLVDVVYGDGGASPNTFYAGAVSSGNTYYFGNGGPASFQFVIAQSSQLGSALTLALPIALSTSLAGGSVAVPLSAVSLYRGQRLGVWGHSLASPGYEYTGVAGTLFSFWQQYLCSLLGMSWVFNDGQPARGYYNAFTNYPGLTLSNMSAPSIGSTEQTTTGGVNGLSRTNGTTLASDLANVDILLVYMGDNDMGNAVGTPGDNAASNTFYGWVNNFLSIIFTAKPSIRVCLIDHAFAGRSFGLAGYQTIRTVLQTAGLTYGVGVIDLLSLGGLNPLTQPVYMNSDTIGGVNEYLHPTNVGWAHFTTIIAKALNSY